MQDNPTTTPTDETEEWLPIVGYESLYSVSSHGRVRRDAAGRGSRAGRIMSARSHSAGYRMVTLCHNDVKRGFLIHRLVLAAFVGPCPEGLVVNHKDGERTNNHLSNLEYMTQGQNIRHAVATGMFPLGDDHWMRRMPERVRRGERVPQSRLTPSQIVDIRKALADGEKGIDVAVRYGVSPTAISRIHKGHTWHHVD